MISGTKPDGALTRAAPRAEHDGALGTLGDATPAALAGPRVHHQYVIAGHPEQAARRAYPQAGAGGTRRGSSHRSARRSRPRNPSAGRPRRLLSLRQAAAWGPASPRRPARDLGIGEVLELDGPGGALGRAGAAALAAGGSIQAAPPRPPTPWKSAQICGMWKGQVRAHVRQPTHLSGSISATTPPSSSVGR